MQETALVQGISYLETQMERLETTAGQSKAQFQAYNHLVKLDAQVSVPTERNLSASAMHVILCSQTMQLHLSPEL